jgi:hypothetical protein
VSIHKPTVLVEVFVLLWGFVLYTRSDVGMTKGVGMTKEGCT